MVYKEDELNKVVDFFLGNMSFGSENKNANVIGLSGNLGAGKTTFVKALLKSLGVTQNVVSPTFVLRRDYEVGGAITWEGATKIIHIDAYRLETPAQIYQVVSKEELADKNNLVLIEWPEKVFENGAGENIFAKIFLFEHISEQERKVSAKNPQKCYNLFNERD